VPIGNVLVVEDDPLWCGIYERNVSPGLKGKLRVARTLAEARQAISEMAFAVAFVDIRLDEEDDQNTDGLRVFETLSRTRDGTSAIMVTGKGSVGITRDALKKYDAFEAMEKGDVDPAVLAELVARGTAIRNATAPDPRPADALRGQHTRQLWDHEMLGVAGAKGGVAGLYEFLDGLAGPFVPFVPERAGDGLEVRQDGSCATGVFWSRAIGAAVFVAFGAPDAITPVVEGSESEGRQLGQALRERSAGPRHGVVRLLPSAQRADFS